MFIIKIIKYIDLFAGMGGMRIGLEQSLKQHNMVGECVLTSEIKPYAIEAYQKNFPISEISGDITKIKEQDIPDFDILLAGFPCQPFSAAGKKLGFEDTRGTMFFEIARILKHKKPQYFLLENVENLVTHDLSKEDKLKGETIGKTLQTILNTLKELGYYVTWKVLQSSHFGVAQIRRRIYIVGSLSQKISLDSFEKTEINFGDIQEKGIGCQETEFTKKIKEYLKTNNKDLSYLYNKSLRDKRGKENNMHSWNIGLRGKTNLAQQLLMEKLLLERRNKEKARKKGVPIKDGVGLDVYELKELYKGDNFENDLQSLYDMGYLKKYKIDSYSEELYDIKCGRLSFPFTKFLDPDKPCLTLVATDIAHLGVIDNDNIRKLTIKECLRLNGYPENYKLDISYNKAMDLLGNTVVVPVIKNICNRIIDNIA